MLYYPVGLDFDGTVVTHDYPEMGKPVPGALIWIQKWIDAGARIILHTMRHGNGLIAAVDYLENAGITLYGVNQNPDQANWTTSPKIYAATYVDDAAAGCPLIYPVNGKRPYVDWSIVGPLVFERIKEKMN